MTKLEMIQKATQERTLEIMNDSIYAMASDVSQLNLDVITIREEIKELRDIIKNWRKDKNDKED